MMKTALDVHAGNAIRLFTGINFDLGVFSLRDVDEVEDVLGWLTDPSGGSQDPRGAEEVEVPGADESARERTDKAHVSPGGGKTGKDEDEPLCLVPRGLREIWVFTLGDPDFYPSIPHGHFQHKDCPEPKLSPYIGRALRADGSEDVKRRLTRHEMILLWNNEEFRSLCLKQIAWYVEAFPHYTFRVADPYRLPRWRLRSR